MIHNFSCLSGEGSLWRRRWARPAPCNPGPRTLQLRPETPWGIGQSQHRTFVFGVIPYNDIMLISYIDIINWSSCRSLHLRDAPANLNRTGAHPILGTACCLLAASSAGLSPGSRMILAIVQAFSGLWSHLEARFGFLARNYSIKTKNLRNQSMFSPCRP